MARRFGDNDGRSGAVVPMADVLTPTVVGKLIEIGELGALVGFCRARDGGAVMLSATYDGEREHKWFRDEADAILMLDEWHGLLIDAGAGNAPPAAGRGSGARGRQNGRGGRNR